MEYFSSLKFYETLVAIAITVLVLAVVKLFDNKHMNSSIKKKHWYRGAKMIRDIFVSFFVVLMILTVLSINGINVGRYLASLGIMGICLSFALQDFLKDLIMGITIVAEGYFKPGDVIVYEGRTGKVKSINLKTTKIFFTDTEDTLSICNRYMDKVAIASDWVDIDVPIGYDVDLHYSRSLVRECAKRIERLRYVYSCDFMNTSELAESWINYRLRIHCLPEKKPPVKRAALAVIQDVFYEHNAEFPLSIKVIYNQENSTKQIIKGNESVELISEEKSANIYNKQDYELGHGAAKSKTIIISKESNSYIKAVNEAERYASSENLSTKMKLRIRLLAEELMSLIQHISQINEGTFYIERDGADYDICFASNAKIDSKNARELIAASSSGGNDAYAGFGGVVAKAIDSMVLMSRSGKSDGNGITDSSITEGNSEYRWSYNIYKETETEKEDHRLIDDLDEINNMEPNVDWADVERSVLIKLSDDVKIFVRTNQINIRILVKGDDDDE